MNQLAPDLVEGPSTRDVLRLLDVMVDRLNAAIEQVEKDLGEPRDR